MIEFVLFAADLDLLHTLEDEIHVFWGTREHNVFPFDGGESLLSYLEGVQGRVDAAFLEVGGKSGSGLELARKISERYPGVRLVAMDGDARRIEEVFLCRPAFFLLEPVCAASLERCLRFLAEDIEHSRCRFLCVANRRRIVNVRYDSIFYLESDRRVVAVHEEKESHIFYEKLDALEERLGPPFLRCHKSFLVNMDKIHTFVPGAILLTDGSEIPVSQNRYAQARAAFVQYAVGRGR